jgi:basic amino acid/polyamine antiporter, APA family
MADTPQHTHSTHPSANAANAENAVFKRELGLLSSTMIVVGSMVGSGVFIVSADIARSVGTPALLMAAWLVTGLVTVIAALSYGELAGMMPQAGGQYVYLREAYNPLVGFLYGWTLFMVIQCGTIAAVGVAFAKFSAVLFPAVSTKNILFSVLGFTVSGGQLLAIASIVGLTALNARGVQFGKVLQNVVTLAKVAALVGLVALGYTLGWNALVVAKNFTLDFTGIQSGIQAGIQSGTQSGSDFWAGLTHGFSTDPATGIRRALEGLPLLSALGLAMVGSIFSSDAWNNITFAAAEVKNPKRTIPLALLLGTLTVTAIYLLANGAYLVTLPLAGTPQGADALTRGIQFATDDRVGVAVAEVIFGASSSVLMAVLIMISTFGCNNGLILAGARVYYAMSLDKVCVCRVPTAICWTMWSLPFCFFTSSPSSVFSCCAAPDQTQSAPSKPWATQCCPRSMWRLQAHCA